MGQLTRDQIIARGQELAGETSSALAAAAAVYLQAWLDELYVSAEWRFLTRRFGPFAIGDTLTIGDGTNTATKLLGIKRVELADPTSDNGYKDEITVDSEDSVDPEQDPAWAPVDSRGCPTRVLATIATSAYSGTKRWVLSFWPKPDKAYRVIVTAIPAVAALSGGSSTPIYPSDLTMIHAVYVFALRWQDDPRAFAEAKELEMLVRADKVKYARLPSTKWQLSKTKFRRVR